MVNFIISTLVALWISAIALVSVQNATPVSLRFLIFETVQIPLGLLLGFSASVGLIGAALIVPLKRTQD
ncbi:MAG TPA: DUF1049 domain-containing protein [Synechococcales cyanobacterium M55_K2018_004]|nr:DUF1049 domain-containing protein [Synechococcales cyanobacterium M55_K2018_004]